jgi:hypothetical protein
MLQQELWAPMDMQPQNTSQQVIVQTKAFHCAALALEDNSDATYEFLHYRTLDDKK